MSHKAPWGLTLWVWAVSGLAVVPLVYILLRAAFAGPATWARLWVGQLPDLMVQSLLLLLGTVTFALLLGVGMAWLVERSDLPGRSVWRVLLALPLAIPGYVAAICYLLLLRRGGVVDTLLMAYAGFDRGEVPLPSLYNLGGATLIIGLISYPYIYLPTAAALRSMDRSLEEAARMLGRSSWESFRQITLPLVAPAIAGGALLVGLYVLSDFGTVAMLRYRTFTTAIYNQFAGQIDRSGAAILSVLLILMALPLLFGEGWFSRRQQRLTSTTAWRPRQRVRLGPLRWLAAGGVAAWGIGGAQPARLAVSQRSRPDLGNQQRRDSDFWGPQPVGGRVGVHIGHPAGLGAALSGCALSEPAGASVAGTEPQPFCLARDHHRPGVCVVDQPLVPSHLRHNFRAGVCLCLSVAAAVVVYGRGGASFGLP